MFFFITKSVDLLPYKKKSCLLLMIFIHIPWRSRIYADKGYTKARKRPQKAHRLPTEANHEATTPCIRIIPQWTSGLKRDPVAASFSSKTQASSKVFHASYCVTVNNTRKKNLKNITVTPCQVEQTTNHHHFVILSDSSYHIT